MHKLLSKNLGDRLFLGIKIEKQDGRLSWDQSAYIRTILEKFRMTDYNHVSTPLLTKLN